MEAHVSTAAANVDENGHTDTDRSERPSGSWFSDEQRAYLRFGAMIATSMVVMFVVMYLNTYELAHVQWSETRFFMTWMMGASMAVVMLTFMLGMHPNKMMNAAIYLASVVVFAGALWLVRSQATVEDTSYMRAMTPHHSIAILTSERANIRDVRVRELADEIIEAQRREIAEMEWLIADIEENGVVTTEEEAAERPVPELDDAP
jgi:uncharacterized protein (DUF305 family)